MAHDKALLDSPLLRRIAPMSVAGHRRLRAVIDTDGALPARVKALYVAVAATTKRYPELARRELARARRAGLSFAEASSAAIVLSSVRGEGAALDFITALEAEYPAEYPGEGAGLGAGDEAEREIRVEVGEAERNFLAYFGAMPPSLGKLLQLLPLGADAYYLMREGTINGTPLGPRWSELMLVTVLVADYSPLAAVHIKGARKAGASEHEIAEAVLCAVPTSGLSAWVAGAAAMDAE